jgi:hypothetical protein
MSITFPSIKPSQREFDMGQFPVKKYRALSGAVAKRSFGNKAHSYRLSVSFENVNDSILAQIWAHYNTTFAGFEGFALPDAMFAGMDATTRSYIQAPSGIEWEYTAPPTVQSVINGISTVSIEFEGNLIAG